ncbi:SDR family oxidoreductase [Lewinella sp. JB7]|uniref:SDR family oxidoreductase n=1 Tax=Lewinella sp. JB7 TaxID=2962887 RepID=UPI0020C941AE|nr:SDR family oxidoreductase [Lewinella sp. JB7]MCP9236317.1 SDR family oxidoreductase [Lewinella sp. JB7]
MKSEITSVDELLESITPPGARQADPGRIRKAIVTGGDTGIGRYTALALAKDGCDVAFTYAHHREDADVTAEAIRRLGRKAYVHHMDLSMPENALPAVDAMVKDLGGIDIFVNNAGAMTMKRFPELELSDLDHLFRINTFGAVLAIQRATRYMLGMDPDGNTSTFDDIAHMARKVVTGEISSPRKTPGRIVVISSVHEHAASPLDTVYTMTKHALGGFIKCAAFALAGTNITINGVRPGEIATPMNDEHPEKATDTDRKFLPARRVGHPSEIASMVRYLASDEAEYCNGLSYDVDGGFSIGEPMVMEGYQKAV